MAGRSWAYGQLLQGAVKLDASIDFHEEASHDLIRKQTHSRLTVSIICVTECWQAL